MKNNPATISAITLLCVFILCFLGCNAETSATNTASPFQNKSLSILTQNHDCQEWQQRYDEISEEAKSNLQIKGIVISNRGGYILSEALMPDCRLRVEIGTYINKVIGGRDNALDKDFATENSVEIVRALEYTWNSYSDGASHEKYLLLENKGIKDKDIAPFIGKLIKTEGFNPKDDEPELFYVLFMRPLPSLNPVILESFIQSEKEGDLLAQVHALLLLNRDTSKASYLSRLKAISKNPKLSNKAREILIGIVNKIKAGTEYEYEEVDNFDIAVFNSIPVEQNLSNK